MKIYELQEKMNPTPEEYAARKAERDALAARLEKRRPFSDALADKVIQGQVKRITELEETLAQSRAEASELRERRDSLSYKLDEAHSAIITSQLNILQARKERDEARAEADRLKTKCISPALYQLEHIRTEKVATHGFPTEASRISSARVALGDAWPEVDQDRNGYVDDLERSRAECREAVEALRLCEWQYGEPMQPYCALCGEEKHAPNCKLAAVLNRVKA